jgi:hypothetical protein
MSEKLQRMLEKARAKRGRIGISSAFFLWAHQAIEWVIWADRRA